ncbi:gastrula zinc finger protein XlCGF32.1 isoform X3 [Bombina bombina]|uniref:gastrula zinc finger protein XlCGF32.1 isoform X3 n=1 Tax=Bombina bombina TaxID=8345 RepID=UPI00235A6985|nr:gastrula zinc finger protein XlCGF32.1 isoform X3 [Bombina bombina]
MEPVAGTQSHGLDNSANTTLPQQTAAKVLHNDQMMELELRTTCIEEIKQEELDHPISHQTENTQIMCPETSKRLIKKETPPSEHMAEAEENRFKCAECDKTFAHKYGLQQHQKLHTGENLHTCQECGKDFTQKAKLISHERTHTGITKPPIVIRYR